MANTIEKLIGIEPAKLVLFLGGEMPRQYRLTDDTVLKTSEEHKYTDGTIEIADLPARDLAVIDHQTTHWTYKNNNEHSKTYINNVLIPFGESKGLKDGDIIRIEDDRVIAGIFFESYSHDSKWAVIPLDAKQPSIHIHNFKDEEEKAQSLQTNTFPKSHHAMLKRQGENWCVQDVTTERGIYVNKQKIDSEQVLKELDVICIGDMLFVYESERLLYNKNTLQKSGLVIHIEERSVRQFLKKRTLLKDIHMTIDHGQMVLLLGGSGAGKTTFVNAVIGYEKADATVINDNVDVYKHYDQMKYQIGFVPQQDLLRGDDTVQMTLMNAAQMRMPSDITDEIREQRVSELLQMFGLEGQKDSQVEKLSGGQRKRLSICVEFIADPSLFVLDEPDSGLDGVMARSLMEKLRQIADQNRIVIVITHTPDRVIDLFDRVIVLAKDTQEGVGRLAFYGSIPEARDFFEKDTMEEIVKSVNRITEGGEGRSDEFIAKYQKLAEERENRK